MFGSEDLDRAEVREEVAAQFHRYEAALRAHDLPALNGFFLARDDTVRFGVADRQYGSDAIASWRATSSPVSRGRKLLRLTIVTFGRDCASASAELEEPGQQGVLRQSQMWVRTVAGWRIAAAHVSVA